MAETFYVDVLFTAPGSQNKLVYPKCNMAVVMRGDYDALQKKYDHAAVIIAEIVALVPLAETLDAAKTGMSLIAWLKRHLAQSSGEGKPNVWAVRGEH